MRPTKEKVQSITKTYTRTDEKGEYILWGDAEKMLDVIFEMFTGIMSQYATHSDDEEELIISTVARKSVLFKIRIKR